MYKILLAIFILILGDVANAQEYTLVSRLRTSFLGPNGDTYYNGPVWQSDFFTMWHSGLFTEISPSVSDGSKGEFGNEISFMLGYSGTKNSLNYDVSVRYIAAYGIDVLKISAELSTDWLFAKVESYRPVESGGPRKGLLSSLGTRHSFPLSQKVELSLENYFLHDTGTFVHGRKSELFAMGNANLFIDIGKKGGVKIKTGTEWSVPLSSVNDGRKEEFAGYLGLHINGQP